MSDHLERGHRLSPSEVKRARAASTNRVRIPKGVLNDLAAALIEFEKLPPADKEWVRQMIDEHDRSDRDQGGR